MINNRFKKIVVLEPIRFDEAALDQLRAYATELVVYHTSPKSDNEIIDRIADADAVLLFFSTRLTGDVIRRCANLRYIGLCCSLYNPESSNVDVHAAQERGIVVTGIRDYGDEGVAEFVVSELIRLLHGFGGVRWRNEPTELGGIKVGIVGLGVTGRMVASSLAFFGAKVYYYSRNRKPEAEASGVAYLPLNELLQTVDVVSTHLHRNTVLMYEPQFEAFGNGKILINTTATLPYPKALLESWLDAKGNFYIGDEAIALGGAGDKLTERPNVICPNLTSGFTIQSGERLRQKVLDNVKTFLQQP